MAKGLSKNTTTVMADLASLDYDALLQAGAAHRGHRQVQRNSSSDEDEDMQLGKQQHVTKGHGTDTAAARATVEDDHFKLGEELNMLRCMPHAGCCIHGALLTFWRRPADEMEAFVQQAEREDAGLQSGMCDGVASLATTLDLTS